MAWSCDRTSGCMRATLTWRADETTSAPRQGSSRPDDISRAAAFVFSTGAHDLGVFTRRRYRWAESWGSVALHHHFYRPVLRSRPFEDDGALRTAIGLDSTLHVKDFE